MAEVIFDAPSIHAALARMAAVMHADEVYIIGIMRGGAAVADALQQRLEQDGCRVHRGDLDISFYRDDLDTIGSHPEVHPSHLPFDMDGKDLWLVDDVLFTGRTTRAALGEIFDYGRPASVRLAVLLDRGGRELPIAADLVGLTHIMPSNMSVKLVCGDGPWRIEQRQVQP